MLIVHPVMQSIFSTNHREAQVQWSLPIRGYLRHSVVALSCWVAGWRFPNTSSPNSWAYHFPPRSFSTHPFVLYLTVKLWSSLCTQPHCWWYSSDVLQKTLCKYFISKDEWNWCIMPQGADVFWAPCKWSRILPVGRSGSGISNFFHYISCFRR